ncbi:MAG TPA: hypothetical protein VE866_01525 [Candidatus Binatia bacterium]|nr:hypothetical protein [Candidatus Binatia bacterium]
MATASHTGRVATERARLPGGRFDHLFFSGIALSLAAAVFSGFARTYYLAGVFRAPLPSLIIHLHGAAFSIWILLLVTQTALVSAGRVDVHRRLGIAAFSWACLMIVLGLLAATDALARGAGPPGHDPKAFFAIPMGDMLIFATLIFFSYRNRMNPSVHKRLLIIATIGLSVAAINRWPFLVRHHNGAPYSYLFLLMLAAYDLWSTHHVYGTTIWGSAFLITIQQVSGPIGRTSAWLHFAAWLQSLAR